jgi:hypothetical protein
VTAAIRRTIEDDKFPHAPRLAAPAGARTRSGLIYLRSKIGGATTKMFVRFRAVRHRLVVNLVATRREGGKIKSEHIARLDSVGLPEPIMLGASSSDCIEADRKLIESCERSIAEKQVSVDLAAQKAHRARMFTLELVRGDRLEGDDDLVLDYVAGAANKRDARIRAQPRPAARGRRGRQKRPR